MIMLNKLKDFLPSFPYTSCGILKTLWNTVGKLLIKVYLPKQQVRKSVSLKMYIFAILNITFISWLAEFILKCFSFQSGSFRAIFFLIHTNKSQKWQFFPFPKLNSKISNKPHIGNNYKQKIIFFFLSKFSRKQNN